MASSAVGAGDRDRAEFHRGHSVGVLREVDALANARILVSVGGMGGTAPPTAAVATVD
jgi:hypothetical protein